MLYSIKFYIDITISISLTLSISVLFIPVLQLINRVQFLNITPLSLSSTYFAANNCASVLPAGSPAFPVIVIVPLKSMYASP